MNVTETDTRAEVVTIALADVGCNVPTTVTVDVTIVERGLEVTRRDDTYLIERDSDFYSLTGVIGRDELPERVPMWLEAVVELFGCDEVALGR